METVPGNRVIGASHCYQRHQPENTPLYPIVEQHLATLRDELQRHEVPLPRFVLTEFQDYLRCGRLEYGFVRVKCNGCRHEHLVAFSCKRRGFCPSCGARRMIETSAHLEPSDTLDQLNATSIRYRIAVGQGTGGRTLTLKNPALVRASSTPKPFTADRNGFSLNCAVACQTHQRGRIEADRARGAVAGDSERGIRCHARIIVNPAREANHQATEASGGRRDCVADLGRGGPYELALGLMNPAGPPSYPRRPNHPIQLSC